MAKALLLMALTGTLFGQPYPDQPIGPPVKKFFFFDDDDVLYRTGTQKVLHPLKKTAHPGLIPYSARATPHGTELERAYWESQIAFVSVYRRPDNISVGSGVGQLPASPRYQMWYQGHTANKTSDRRKKSNVCYAYSEDGLKWIRPGRTPGSNYQMTPGLGLHDFVFNVRKNADNSLTTINPPNPADVTQDAADGSYQYFSNDETNIVMIGSGGYGERFDNSVLVEPYEPDPNRKYKMMFYDWTCESEFLNDNSTFPNNVTRHPNPDPDRIGAGLQVAFSPDGIHWTKVVGDSSSPGHPGPAILSRNAFNATGQPPTTVAHDNDPLDFWESSPGYYRWQIPFSMADAYDVMYDPVRHKYVSYSKAWVQGPSGELTWKHAMGRIESSDFVHWSTPEPILTTGDKDPDNVMFHTSPAFYYEGLYLSLNQIYTNPALTGPADALAENVDIELMSSRDGIRWDRNFIGQTILPRGAIDPSKPLDAGYYKEFDSADIFTNSCPIVLDSEIRFYYGGYGLKSGVGLATVERDRIVGLQAKEGFGTGSTSYLAGQVTLRKVNLTGINAIAVNGTVDAGGSIKVELLNRDGNPIPGYTLANSTGLTTNATPPYDSTSLPSDPLNRKVAWTGSGSLSGLSAADRAECFIRLHLKNAEVFSCSLVP